MKLSKLTLLSLTLLTTLLLGAVAINVILAPAEIKLKVKWKPVEYLMDSPSPPDPWWAELSAPRINPDDIVTSTILLEGLYSIRPTPPPYMTLTGRLAVPFYGGDVLTALLAKAPHLAPGEYRINLEITGQLDDGTPLRGSGGITLWVNEIPPP